MRDEQGKRKKREGRGVGGRFATVIDNFI